MRTAIIRAEISRFIDAHYREDISMQDEMCIRDRHGDVHVAALAGDDGGTQHGAPAKQITHQLFRPCGGRVEDVTHDDLIRCV